MTNYFDNLGRPLGAYGKESENEIENYALYFILNLPTGALKNIVAIYDEINRTNILIDYNSHPERFSHDNNVAAMAISHDLMFDFKLSWKQLMHFIPSFYRDIPFYLLCRHPKTFFFLRPVLAIWMIWTQFPHAKQTPFYRRWWIKLFCKYESEDTANPDVKTWYYTNKTKNDTIIRWHRDSLDGKLLNILRVHRLRMKTVAKILDYVDQRNNQSLERHVFNYFERDELHPIIKSAWGKTYRDLV